MRIVTFFILITLAAAVYVANFAAKSGDATESTDAILAEASKGAPGSGSASLRAAAGSGAQSDALPSAFPAELTKRSGGSSNGMGPLVNEEGPDRVSRPEQIQFDGASRVADESGSPQDAGPPEAAPEAGLGRLDVRPPSGRRRPTREVKLRDPSDSEGAGAADSTDEFIGDSGPTNTLEDVTNAEDATNAEDITNLEDVTNLEDPNNGLEELASSELEKGGSSAPAPITGASSGLDKTAQAEFDKSAPADAGAERSTTSTTSPGKPGEQAELPSAPQISQGIRGSVNDSNGKPVKGLRVGVVSLDSGSTVQTMTSALDGTFAASGLEAGRYALEIEPDSVPLGISIPVGPSIRRSGSEPAGYGSVCADVAANGVASAEVILPLSSGVQGTVLGFDGKPAKGVLVRAVSAVEGFEDTRTITKSDGQGFFFLALVPGPFELQILAPGDSAPEARVRRMKIQAKPGSALLLEAVDLREEATGDQSFGFHDQAESTLPVLEPKAQPQEPMYSSDDLVAMSVGPEAAVAPEVIPASLTRIPEIPEPSGDVVPASPQRKGPSATSVAAAIAARAKLAPKPKDAVVDVRAPAVKLAEETAETTAAKTVAEAEAVVAPPVEIALPTEAAELTELAEVAPSTAELPELLDPTSPTRVHLRGRVISRWGETLSALPVRVETADGKLIDITQTSDAGLYVFENVPVGPTIVRVAPTLKIGRSDGRGTTLLERPDARAIVTSAGQKVVALEDVVVNLRRVYRLAGRIEIQKDALETFKKALRPVNLGQDSMTDAQYRSAYLRGLRLVQQNKGGADRNDSPSAAAGQPIAIASDGTFLWHCTLPADDILLVLEPRTTRMSAGYGSAVGIPVIPAGVRPASLTIEYPSSKATTGGAERVAGR